MSNIRGEKFDIYKTGQMEFVRVPYESVTKEANFTVLATIQEVSGTLNQCEQSRYITSLAFGGAWLGDRPLNVAMHTGQMVVQLDGDEIQPSRQRLPIGHMLQLQVMDANYVQVGVGTTSIDISTDVQPSHFFLNVRANGLSSLGYRIGGLLGEDDHVDVSMPPAGCKRDLLTAARRFYAAAVL